MFCSKCGTKAIDGAVFCQKCGAKLIQNNRGGQEAVPAPIREAVEMPNPSIGTSSEQTAEPNGGSKKSKSQEEIYALLKKEALVCYGVKSVKIMRNGLRVRGRTHVHFINIMNGTAKLQSRFILIFGLLGAWAGHIGFNMGWNAMEQGYIYFEDYAWTFALFSIIVGLLIALMPYIGYKEKASVRECVRKIAEPEGISLKTNEMKPAVRFVTSAILILIGVMVFIFGVLGVEFGGRGFGFGTVFSDEDSDDGYDLDRDESVSLKRTYVSEEEGFSFMYPNDWKIEDVEEVNPDALVSVACTGMFGTYARIAVAKDIDDGFCFDATKADFEEAYSYEAGINDVKVIDLSDIELDGCPARKLTVACNNDAGVRVILIQYFYIRESYVYYVACAVVEDYYERFEPRINAIMDSYTITATGYMKSGLTDIRDGLLILRGRL